jgi:hypothetical protein
MYNDSYLGHFFETDRSLERDKLEVMPEVLWLKKAYPIFNKVKFRLVEDPSFEGGRFQLPKSKDDLPEVELASGGPQQFGILKETRAEGVGAMARYLGISVEKISPETIQFFILLHEAGHAYDFLENFVYTGTGESFGNILDMWETNSQMQLDTLPY